MLIAHRLPEQPVDLKWALHPLLDIIDATWAPVDPSDPFPGPLFRKSAAPNGPGDRMGGLAGVHALVRQLGWIEVAVFVGQRYIGGHSSCKHLYRLQLRRSAAT